MKFRLSQEIIFMMIIKLALVYLIWALCFSHPIDKTMTAQDMSKHFIQPAKWRAQ